MKPILSGAALLLTLSVAAGCALPGTTAPSPDFSDRSAEADPSRRGARPAADRIPLLEAATPACPFTDLGVVEARTLRHLRREAFTRGADAVIDFRSERQVDTRLSRTAEYRGRAIRFDDPTCRN